MKDYAQEDRCEVCKHWNRNAVRGEWGICSSEPGNMIICVDASLATVRIKAHLETHEGFKCSDYEYAGQ